MFKESLGICTLATLLLTHGYHVLESRNKDDFKTVNKRFLLDTHSVASNITLEQFASCYITCIPTYNKLLETCCQTGLNAVCSNLPWDILKPKLGTCTGLVKSPTSSSWVSLEQFAACFLTCVVNYEKLAAACCQTGLDAVCSNLPWDMLKPHLGTCQDSSVTTASTQTISSTGTVRPLNVKGCTDQFPDSCSILILQDPDLCKDVQYSQYACRKLCGTCDGLYGYSTIIPTTTFMITNKSKTSSPMTSPPPTTPTAHKPYWLPWGRWICHQQPGSCFQKRLRNCSTGSDNDCIQSQGGIQYNVGLCTETSCPGIPVTTTKSTIQKLPATDCFYDSNKYMGAYSTSVSGKICMNWFSLDPTLDGFPDDSITYATNKCRDPDKRGFPWCYTSDSFDWEYCPVPFCKECFYANQSANYEGYFNTDNENNTCDFWTNYVAQTGDTKVNFPNNSVADAANYCRDPNNTGVLQCFNGVTLKSCDVGQCPHECRDDPETNCGLVQKFVCRSEYTGSTLCPKTCNMCKFGLLPSVKLDPPADICVDNPDANCAILQSIICSDPDGALKLCPKTCQKCNLLYGKSTVTPMSQLLTSPMTSPLTVTTQTTTSLTKTSPLTSAEEETSKSTTTSPMTSSTTAQTTTTKPYWLPWGSWECKQQSGSCFQKRLRDCSTGSDNNCIQSQGGIQYNVGLCTETSCPEFFTTTAMPSTTPKVGRL